MTVDTNIILRYLLDDIKEQANLAKNIIENKQIFIHNEIIAEVVYVLEKVYKVKRNLISEIIEVFINFDNITMYNKETIKFSLTVFSTSNLDFVDCLLCAYSKIENLEVITFDKKLKLKLEELSK